MADSVSSTATAPSAWPSAAVAFFDPYEGDGSDTVANDDQSEIDGIPFIDACGGHPLPKTRSATTTTDSVLHHRRGRTDGEHSTLIGYLFDGFGIYRPQSDGSEPTDLDACMGHTGRLSKFSYDTW